jgi:hypothetical protein
VKLGVGFTAVTAALALVLAAGAATPPPTLKARGHNPLVVSGTGFRAAERVTVIVRTSALYVRRVTAGAQGGFTARFDGVHYAPCVPYRVTATGAKGSRAVYVGPRPVCVNREGPPTD